jgi:NTP pyrophosphatase (non-canonical NTP hydrolase)
MQKPSLEEMIDDIIILAREKHWGIEPSEVNVPEKFALLHSEVSEAYEAFRRDNFDGKDGVREELADIAIRLFHLSAIFKIDLAAEIKKKIERNRTRDWNHKNETLMNKDAK